MTLPPLSGALSAIVDTNHQWYRVFVVYLPIALAVVVIVFGSAIVLAIKNRRRGHATRTRENNHIELGYTILLSLIVIGLLVLTFSAMHQEGAVASTEKPSVVINVTAARWEWDFYYPALHKHVLSGTTGFNTFVVPTNEVVEFRLTSVDVVHAFWIPELRFKHDNTPGSTQVIKVDFPRAGRFQGHCAEYCGLRHADMAFYVRAVSPAAYRRWAQSGGKASLT